MDAGEVNAKQMEGRGRVLFRPSPDQIENCALTRFARYLQQARGLEFGAGEYAELHAWSIEHLADFWSALAEYFEVRFKQPATEVLVGGTMPNVHWFRGATLNYAEHALRWTGTRDALVYVTEGGQREVVSRDQLRQQVLACRRGLISLGVGSGNRVAAYLPNTPQAVVAFLAVASLGAVWSSCPPEFGQRSVLDRFQQIKPKVLLGVDGYAHGGKWFDRTAELSSIRRGLPELDALVLLHRGPRPIALAYDLLWEDLLVRQAPSNTIDDEFDAVAFEHPLWVLYSSGTTGKPKAIVHGHGGILLEHLKMISLHSDIGGLDLAGQDDAMLASPPPCTPWAENATQDRFFWYSTTGWMMWNYLIGGLLSGATIVLYEGHPGFPDLGALWRMAAREEITHFGCSAPFILACRDRRVQIPDLSALRSVGSTGAPLPEEGFEWVDANVSPKTARGVQLASISGGTDLCTAFLCASPWHVVRSGELCCAALGADVQSYSDTGGRQFDALGELVITRPMPSMPLYFWGDEQQQRLRESYFGTFPGVWRHGDWLRQFQDGGAVIYGRSDSTLNRAGVRMGTSEFYRVVEALDGVSDSLVVDTSALGTAGLLWLFVVPTKPAVDAEPAEPLLTRLKRALREQLSPRHVPDRVILVDEIPYTLSGKKLEVPVKRILAGADPEAVAAAGTLRNPAALAQLIARARSG